MFLDEGLKEVFDDISPIADYNGRLSLEFVDFTLCEDESSILLKSVRKEMLHMRHLLKSESDSTTRKVKTLANMRFSWAIFLL